MITVMDAPLEILTSFKAVSDAVISSDSSRFMPELGYRELGAYHSQGDI